MIYHSLIFARSTGSVENRERVNVPGGLQFLIIITCFAWRPVRSTSENRTCARELQY